MHKYIFLLSVLTVGAVSCGEIQILDPSLPETTIEQCINCVCYARTGQWDINLCGPRFITLTFWKNVPTEKNKNCILNAIKSYTEQFGAMNCNFDGIPTAVFNQVHSCLSNVIQETSGGRYKRNILPGNTHINLNINQHANGNGNNANQNLQINIKGR